VACEYKKIEVVKHLTEQLTEVVDANACCHSGKDGTFMNSALHLAAIHNSVEVAELMLSANCSLNLVDKDVSYA
jgi:hypothetical protein